MPSVNPAPADEQVQPSDKHGLSKGARAATLAALKSPAIMPLEISNTDRPSHAPSRPSQAPLPNHESGDPDHAKGAKADALKRSTTVELLDAVGQINKITIKKDVKGFKKSQTFVRADLLDMGDLDTSLTQRLPKSISEKATSTEKSQKHSWEIDLDKLILKEQIAKGAYGTVHRGIYNGDEVAIKLLDWGEEDTMCRAQLSVLRKAFLQEVEVWSQLSHPNVTDFIGATVGKNEGFMIPSFQKGSNGELRIGGNVCCVVLEFMSGGTLKEFLIKNYHKKLPLKTVVNLALDFARGLAYMHEKRIVHRDVKTENLLLDKKGVVKIADFGVARVQAHDTSEMTGATGTVGYMAPEVLDGKPYNEKADVYSFGICVWEIYACDMPFPDLSFKEMAAVVNQGLRPTIPSCCPSSLAEIMRKCWDTDPNHRPNMNEVVNMLEKVDVKKGKPMTKTPESRMSSGCFCI